MTFFSDNHDTIVIRWRTDSALTASVRDDAGIWDCHWSAQDGWSCSCADGFACSHTLAIKAIASVAS